MRAARAALLASALGAALAARAGTWDPADVAAAERMRAEESARASEYRRRVARGDVRADAAPMPRSAPQTTPAPGDTLRDAADLVDWLDRVFGREGRRDATPRGEERTREELRREQREKRRPRSGADDWWDEEERRMRGTR
jgi:hypothetical protein